MQLDSTTGLYYLRARYMKPSTGTFISMDTYGGSIFDPVSLHKYLYANANPVMNSAPTGYFTLPEFGIANAIGKTIDTIQNDAFALAVWRSFKAGFMCAAYDAYRQWRTTGKIDWGHVLETFVVGTSVGVVFGGSAVLAASLRSVAIYTALGASAFTLGAFGLAGAAADGEAGYYDLAILDVIFSLQAMKGAEKCFDNAYEVATARNTAGTTTNALPENTNKAQSQNSSKKTGTVTVRRVQGGADPSGKKISNGRVTVNPDGSIKISGKKPLYVSIDNGEHSSYFLMEKRGGVGDIVEFEIPDWMYDFIVQESIPQKFATSNPGYQNGMAPQLVDPDTPGVSYGLGEPWLEWLMEYATNGRVISYP